MWEKHIQKRSNTIDLNYFKISNLKIVQENVVFETLQPLTPLNTLKKILKVRGAFFFYRKL